MSKKIGVGIIGVQPDRSWAAVAHIPALQALSDDFEIVALSTTRQESADAAAERYGVANAFDSAEKLCAHEGVDLVAVTVKVPHHLELVRTAAAAGKHVYCEWPLGNGLAEAREIAALAASAGVKAACGMQARFSPVLAYAKDLIAQGYVGDVLSVSVIGSGLNWGGFVDKPNAYTFNIRNGATMLAIAVGHTLDGICQAVGEVAEVRALLANARKSAILVETGEILPLTTHDQVLFDGLLESGAPISLHYRGGMPRGTGLLIEINGTAGDLQITGPGGHAQLLDLEIKGASGEDQAPAPLTVPESYFGVDVQGSTAGNVARFYKQFAADLRDGTALCPSFEEAVKRHQLIAAIEASAQSGNPEKPASF
jgi:predicted dehydrogenase